MAHQNIWYSHPRKNGKGSRGCRVSNTHNGVIRKYNLMICRRFFREYADKIGFQKLD